jgi:hypothetical protein
MPFTFVKFERRTPSPAGVVAIGSKTRIAALVCVCLLHKCCQHWRDVRGRQKAYVSVLRLSVVDQRTAGPPSATPLVKFATLMSPSVRLVSLVPLSVLGLASAEKSLIPLAWLPWVRV